MMVYTNHLINTFRYICKMFWNTSKMLSLDSITLLFIRPTTCYSILTVKKEDSIVSNFHLFRYQVQDIAVVTSWQHRYSLE